MSVVQVTHYERRHRETVQALMYQSYQTHFHLDWHTFEYWLESPLAMLRLAWMESQLVGVIGVSQPLNQTAWLRVVVIKEQRPVHLILSSLWQSVRGTLTAEDVQSVWALVSHEWLTDYLTGFGFEKAEMVVTLQRHTPQLPEAPARTDIHIRPFEVEQLNALTEVDQTAFAPPWQLAHSDLWEATRLAASCTTAWQADQMVGYQLSTRHRNSAHLARLAVLPAMQGQGVGAILLRQMIDFFAARQIYDLTVNTQLSNVHSQRLYQRYLFSRNGYDMPVWKADLAALPDGDI